MEKVRIFLQKLYSKLPVILFDVCSIPIACFLAFLLRDDLEWFPVRTKPLDYVSALLLLLTVQVASYYYFKVYRGLWRFSSLSDVFRILKSVACATFLMIPALYMTGLLHAVPRSVFLLYALLLPTMLCGARLIMRSYLDKKTNRLQSTLVPKRVLIIGAGQAGEGLVRDLKRMNAYLPVGFVDDNVNKKGLEVHGVRVLGTVQGIADLVKEYDIDLIFIALPSARSATMRRIVSRCEATNIPFRTLPSIQALASGRVEVNALREVSIEDLLGRDQVQLTWDKISHMIQGKRVLVTGGGGSIGMELCRQIMALNPKKLLILDNSEFNLYKIDQELATRFPDTPRQLALISVTDSIAVNYTFEEFKPEIVFHAAAFKHVPMLENQVRVAVKNNVLGTQIVAEASIAIGVQKFILISTDKAVNPTNVMGTTKRVAEIYCQNLNGRTATQFITVRFGNVLGSAGSVVPLFQKQLQTGGPLTVTHPDIQRYFMTIPEACQLILQAMVNGAGGEIFVLDMGEPIKISYLAELMIRLAGKEPGKDIEIQYTGLRPGEKLFEELFHPSEQLVQTEHKKLFKAKFRQINWNDLMESFRLLHNACNNNQNEELLVILNSLVPEFVSILPQDLPVR